MATPVTSSPTTDPSPARVHIWRVLTMLVALTAVVCALVVILTSAA